MKIPFYTQTAGLERYPYLERWSVYRAAHKRLLREDPVYRRRWVLYLAAVVCLLMVSTLGWVAVVVLAFHQQAFQNQRIGDMLQVAS